MKDSILQAYQTERAARPDAGGKAPALTERDQMVANLAANYSEADLRQAVVMRAAYSRELLAKQKANAQ